MHSTGYLPMYIAMAKDYFAEADINVKIVTIETGAGHTNAVLSGQAFAFIGGPEHCAFAKAKGAELRGRRALRRSRQRLLLRGEGPGAEGPRLRRLRQRQGARHRRLWRHAELDHTLPVKKWSLDAKTDVTLVETANSAILAAVSGKAAQFGCSTEPFITQGVRQGIWDEPFFNVPKELGPYAYSTINIRLDSIKKEPEVVRGFVRGMMKGLKFLYANQQESAEIAKKQFPTMPLDDLKATLDRSFADEMWSKDGTDQPRSLGYRQGCRHGGGHSENGCSRMTILST